MHSQTRPTNNFQPPIIPPPRSQPPHTFPSNFSSGHLRSGIRGVPPLQTLPTWPGTAPPPQSQPLQTFPSNFSFRHLPFGMRREQSQYQVPPTWPWNPRPQLLPLKTDPISAYQTGTSAAEPEISDSSNVQYQQVWQITLQGNPDANTGFQGFFLGENQLNAIEAEEYEIQGEDEDEDEESDDMMEAEKSGLEEQEEVGGR